MFFFSGEKEAYISAWYISGTGLQELEIWKCKVLNTPPLLGQWWMRTNRVRWFLTPLWGDSCEGPYGINPSCLHPGDGAQLCNNIVMANSPNSPFFSFPVMLPCPRCVTLLLTIENICVTSYEPIKQVLCFTPKVAVILKAEVWNRKLHLNVSYTKIRLLTDERRY